MGRPINKKFLGDAAGSIKVSHYFLANGAEEITGQDDTFIISQRSTNKFLVSDTSDAFSEVLTLVNKAAGTLVAGEFRIDATTADGTALNTVRLYNRTVRVTGNIKTAWDINAPSDLPIASITEADPAVIEVGNTATLKDGDEVTIDGGDMTEIDGVYAVTVINGTTFSVDFDSTGATTYNNGGVVSGIGSRGSIDTQDA